MGELMKVLVCGGRLFSDKKLFDDWTNNFFINCFPWPDVIISGGARGADSLAIEWAEKNNVPCAIYKPKWHTDANYRPWAGLERNSKMLELQPDIVIAWPGEKGTMDTVTKAKQKNIKVIFPMDTISDIVDKNET